MQERNAPPCPQCGNVAATLAVSHPRFAVTDHIRTWPIGMSYVYTCSCGMSFTHEDDKAPSSVRGELT